MIGFIIFSKQVLENIKISNIIESEYDECKRLIEKEVEERKKAKRHPSEKLKFNISIPAYKTGYVYKIDANEILKELNGLDAELVITKRIGEYTTETDSVATLIVYGAKKIDDDLKIDLTEKISKAIVINVFNNSEENYHRGLVNLTEIANMALSPGTNDPNSAIMCINKISSLLGNLLSTYNQFTVLAEDDKTKIIYQSYSVEDELYFVFSQIILYSAKDPVVTLNILQGLYLIYTLANPKEKQNVKDFFDVSYDSMIENFTSQIHLKRFKVIKDNIDYHAKIDNT